MLCGVSVCVCACVSFLIFSTIQYIPMGGKLPICQLGLSLVISDQYSIRRLLTVFYYICRCVSFGVAGVDARIGWLTAGGHVLWICCVLRAVWVGDACVYFWLCIYGMSVYLHVCI